MSILFHQFYPLIDDLAEFRVDLLFVITVTARPDDPRTLTDKTLVLIRPLDNLEIPSAFFHCFDSLIFCCTSRSWYGLASSPRFPESVIRGPF